jgi:hypothetical protein
MLFHFINQKSFLVCLLFHPECQHFSPLDLKFALLNHQRHPIHVFKLSLALFHSRHYICQFPSL